MPHAHLLDRFIGEQYPAFASAADIDAFEATP